LLIYAAVTGQTKLRRSRAKIRQHALKRNALSPLAPDPVSAHRLRRLAMPARSTDLFETLKAAVALLEKP
jgi:hypothetical protein